MQDKMTHRNGSYIL